MTLEEFVAALTEDLDAGLSTQDIEERFGVQYESLRRRLSKNGKTELRLRLIQKRQQEWTTRRPYVMPPFHRIRCTHGGWSKDGSCQHGPVPNRKAQA